MRMRMQLDVFDVSEWEPDESMEGQVACIYNMYYGSLKSTGYTLEYMQCVQYMY